ncbi:MFS transporter [uncultured Muribaculum sp.]|uniref:MFS transporter n=1 Tax=uncultured Muribaculum sp. TaxID=1918613 RepID=UPI0026DFF8D0|nr:MFS transporter [uncultured Muribaculum sp.]
MNSTKIRLSILSFLQFAVWGSYLVCLGQYLGPAGLGSDIAWFYSVVGFVSIFMPAVIGVIADRWIPGQKLLGICHFLAAVFMILAWNYGQSHPTLEFTPFFTLYTLSVAFYMPTIALSNSVSFSILKSKGGDTVKDFPPIRVLGTVGFIVAMWFVNCAYYHDGHFGFTISDENPFADFRFQYTDMQLLVSGITGLLLAAYSFFLPNVPVGGKNDKNKGIMSILGLDAFKLFKDQRMFVFFFFSMLLGVALQITNGFATTFITSFKGIAEYANTFGANNATLLTSLSQISDALCILMIPFFLKRYGIKNVMLIAMIAWVLRFGFFGIGNPGSGLWMFILSMIVYGVAFDFFNVSGALFVEQETHDNIKASAQGLFMLMTNGVGASIGTLIAGGIVNRYCSWQEVDGHSYMLGDWSTPWLIFAGYSLVVAILFKILFKYKHVRE